MANSTNSTGLDFHDVENVFLFVGLTAKAFWNITISTVLVNFADFLDANPNATHTEYMDALGAESLSRIDDLLWGLNSDDDMRYYVSETVAMLPDLPHGTGTSGLPVTFAVMTVLVTLVMSLRLYARRSLVGKVLWYDWTMFVGYLLALAFGIVCLLHAVRINKTLAVWDMTYWDWIYTQLYLTMISVFYPLPLFFIKASLLHFYYCLAPSGIAPVYLRISIYITFGITVVVCLVSVFTSLFACKPVNYWYWQITSVCNLDYTAAQVWTGVIGVFTDVVIWIIPLPLVYMLPLNRTERFLAIVTFGVGAVACIVSGFRIDAIRKYNNIVDGKELAVKINILSIIELNLAIICGSVPSLRALLVHCGPKLLGRQSSAAGEQSDTNEANDGTWGDRRPSAFKSKTIELPHHRPLESQDSSVASLS